MRNPPHRAIGADQESAEVEPRRPSAAGGGSQTNLRGQLCWPGSDWLVAPGVARTHPSQFRGAVCRGRDNTKRTNPYAPLSRGPHATTRRRGDTAIQLTRNTPVTITAPRSAERAVWYDGRCGKRQSVTRRTVIGRTHGVNEAVSVALLWRFCGVCVAVVCRLARRFRWFATTP